jgi:nucleotide-binding universal stress UspA family protein
MCAGESVVVPIDTVRFADGSPRGCADNLAMVTRPQRIIVAYDDSEPAKRALERAAAMTGYGSTLTVVSVAPTGGASGGDVLAHARERLLSKHVMATYLQPVGEPADELVTAATELGADVVVVGRRSGNLLRRLMLGSVSAKVVSNAPCDVLVVH